MSCLRTLVCVAFALTLAQHAFAADDQMPPPGYLPGHRERESIGLSPHVPGEQSLLPGGLMPQFGAPLMPNEGAKFDFHGYLQAGGRLGLGKRQHANDDQSSLTLHGDPVVPRGNVFENTNTVPYTWAELRFSYSLPTVTANVSLAAWSLAESMQAAGSYQPNAELWIRDAFLSYVPRGLGPLKLTANIGVFEDRYGALAQYSNGMYGTPLIATLEGVGETISASLPVGGGLSLNLEQGLKSSLGRPPPDMPTGPSNNWQKPWEGQTFVNHLHAGFNYKDMIQPSVHFLSAMARDDQADQVPLGSLRAGYQLFGENQIYAVQTDPKITRLDHADASLNVVAADVRLNLKRWGYFYGGFSRASADHIRSLSAVIKLLYAGGGRDLMDRYFGRDNDRGRGTLTLIGAQYDIGLGELLRWQLLHSEFWGEGPDLKLSLSGLYAHISSDDPAHDGEDKYKYGIEATYSMLSWLALSGRYDHAVPYAHKPKAPLYQHQNDNSYSVLTAKFVFRSDWLAREALTLQYSHYIYRSHFHLVSLNAGGQISGQSDEPDQHVLALYGTLWW